MLLAKVRQILSDRENARELNTQAEQECSAGDYAKAAETFDAALKYDPSNEKINARKAQALKLAERKRQQELSDSDEEMFT